MGKVLLINGSNRLGNCYYLLNKLSQELNNNDLLMLKDKNILFCKGCLACYSLKHCIIDDDINDIIDKVVNADLIIFAVPNYFDNVSGLFKNFIDRLHPLYKSKQASGKKVIFIFVGGGNTLGTEQDLMASVKGFVKYLGLDVLKTYSYKALMPNDLVNDENNIKIMIEEIKSLDICS